MISAPTKSGYPVWGTVHIRPRKTEIRYRGRNVSARWALFRLPRRGRSQTGPPDPAFPSLRPRRGGPRGRPPRRIRHSLPFSPVGAALAAARRVQYTFSFDPPSRPPGPTACGPLGRTPTRAAPQRFRVGGIANSREAAGAHCAPLRKDGYPARRADNIRPYEKPGARRGGRMISAPTKSGNLVWGAVHIRPTKSGNSVWERCISTSTKNGNPIPWAERVHPMRGVPPPP